MNATFMLKGFGLFKDTMGAEQTWAIVNLWVAFVMYNIVQGYERNPIYGGVFIWVLLAIKDCVSTKEGLAALESNLQNMIAVHCLLVALLSAYLVAEKVRGWRFDNWDHGLLY
jgi:hypothetical protein